MVDDRRKASQLSAQPLPHNYDFLLDREIHATIDEAEKGALPFRELDLPIYDILRYHLGFANSDFQPERGGVGKRVRPRLCALSCAAAGGGPERAIHAAAAIELLHNFTLIHDDIQDQSPLRRHRQTVWALWGVAQAINAGDAMFSLACLAMNRSSLSGVQYLDIHRLTTGLHQTTLRIVEGQTLDLGFESRDDVTASEYIAMIGGKTAAITRFACRAGAIVAGAPAQQQRLLGEFGFSLGVGFQLQDDALGVWGATEDTGKTAADDIRRRKKSHPLILLREKADTNDRATLVRIYQQSTVTESDVSRVLDMLNLYEIVDYSRSEVQRWHDRARDLLHSAVEPSPARDELTNLVESLARRLF